MPRPDQRARAQSQIGFRRDGVEAAKSPTTEDERRNLCALLATCQCNEDAFAKLYELTKRKMFGVALMILRHSDSAEEVLQEAYIRIWRHADRYEPAIGSPITWMATIVRNHAIDTLRRSAIAAGQDGDEGMLVSLRSLDQDALESIEASERRSLAFSALKALNPLQRTLIVAAYVRGESREQLAARFGKPVGTIKTWLRRAILQVGTSLSKATAEG